MDSEPGTIALYAVVLLVGALLKAWPAPACNNPLFAGEFQRLIWSFA